MSKKPTNPLQGTAAASSDDKSVEEIKEDMKDIGVGTEVAAAPEAGKSEVELIRQHSNIPLRYREAKFEAKTEQQEKLVGKIRENLSSKSMDNISDMLVIGNVGTGKTHIVIGALNSLIEKGVWCRYATEYQLLDMYFRKEYSKFDGFKEAKVLVIDEVGKSELVDWQKKQLEELISERYNMMLPTIFITNLNTEEFKRFVGDRVSDRLRDNNVIRVAMTGESLRGSNGR